MHGFSATERDCRHMCTPTLSQHQVLPVLQTRPRRLWFEHQLGREGKVWRRLQRALQT